MSTNKSYTTIKLDSLGMDGILMLVKNSKTKILFILWADIIATTQPTTPKKLKTTFVCVALFLVTNPSHNHRRTGCDCN